MRTTLLLLASAFVVPSVSGWTFADGGRVVFSSDGGASIDHDLWTPNPDANSDPRIKVRSISDATNYDIECGGGEIFAMVQSGSQRKDKAASLVSVPFYAGPGTVVTGFTLFDTSEKISLVNGVQVPPNDDYSNSWLESLGSPANTVRFDRSTAVYPNGPLLTWRPFTVPITVGGNYRFNFSISNAGDNLNPRCVILMHIWYLSH